MADVKTLQTRIALKYDTYANWTNADVADQGANLVLLKGELGICEVKATNPQTKDANIIPTVLFKVGDGETPFKDLPWASAKAADVYAWAKASDLVVEGKSIKFVGVKDAEGNDKKITFNFATPEEVAADIEVVSDNLAGVDARVVALENKFTGDGSVQGQIDALDGRLDVIEGADTVEGSVAKALKDAKAYADGLAGNYDAAGDAATAEQNAKDYADDLDEAMGKRVDGVASDLSAHVAKKDNPHGVTAEQVGLGKVENKTVAEIKTEFTGTVAANDAGFVTGGAVHTAVEAAKTASNTYADGLNTAMDKRVDDLEAAKTAQDTKNGELEQAIADEASARGTAITNATNAITSAYEAADLAISNKIGSVTDGKTVVGMISDAQTAAEGKVTALENGQVKTNKEAIATNAGEITRVEGLVTAEAKAREDADKVIDERLDAVEAFFATTEGKTLDTALDTLVEIQDYLNGEGSATDGMLGRLSQAETDIDNLEKEFNTDTGRVKVVEGKIAALEAKDTELNNAIGTKLATDTFNTWKGTHENDHAPSATQIASNITTAVSGEESARKAADKAITDAIGTSADGKDVATVYGAIADAKAAGTDAAAAASAVAGRMDTAEGEIDALQGASHTHANKTELDLIVSGDKAKWDDAYAKRHEHTNKAELDLIATGDKAKWDTAATNAGNAVADLAALTGDSGRVKAAENAIDALELIVNDASKGNDKLRTDVNALQTLTGDAAKGNVALYNEITRVAGLVDNATTGLAATKAIADKNKTDIGTLNGKVAAIEGDYLKKADLFIFDCGSATKVTHVAE